MPTHLYCLIAEDEAPAPGDTDVRGLGDAPVRALDVSPTGRGVRMVAWVSTVAEPRIPRELAQLRTAVLQHDRVTQAALQHARGVVPALIADPYPDDDGCREAMAARSSEIDALWSRARDTVEMTLLLAPDVAPVQAAPTRRAATGDTDADAGRGRRYLETLRDTRHAIEDRATIAVDALTAAVGPMVIATARRDDRDRIALSHAVSRDQAEAYRRSAAEVALPAGLKLTVDGPRAPYSFAALAAPFRRHDSGELIGD
jgi:hypothetical protein